MIVTAIKTAFDFQAHIDILTGLLNRSTGKAGLAEGTNANTIKTVTAIDFCINGVPGAQYGATDNIAMTACATQAVSTYCKYLVSIHGTTVTTTKGEDAATAALALLPALPSTDAPIGWFQQATDSTHTFTSGTTDLSAAGMTPTFGDLNSVITVS
jgi:hypothetical protein